MSPHQFPLFGSIPIAIYFTLAGATPATLANTNANGNYSGAGLSRFQVIPTTGERWVITQVKMILEDNASINEDGYGQVAATLTTGIQFYLTDNSNNPIYDFLNGLPVLKNTDWYKVATYTQILAGNSFPVLVANFKFPQPLLIEGGFHRLTFVLNDDFTGRNIKSQVFFAHGFKIRTHEAKGESPYTGY